MLLNVYSSENTCHINFPLNINIYILKTAQSHLQVAGLECTEMSFKSETSNTLTKYTLYVFQFNAYFRVPFQNLECFSPVCTIF